MSGTHEAPSDVCLVKWAACQTPPSVNMGTQTPTVLSERRVYRVVKLKRTRCAAWKQPACLWVRSCYSVPRCRRLFSCGTLPQGSGSCMVISPNPEAHRAAGRWLTCPCWNVASCSHTLCETLQPSNGEGAATLTAPGASV